jgi:L-lysine 2,3-aminomutase
MAMTIGYVYRLVCKDVNANEIYVGSSTSLRNRRSDHKKCSNNADGKKYNYKVYQYIRANGGWNNFNLIPIERMEFEWGWELKDRERFHMEALHATLNSQTNQAEISQKYDNRETVHVKYNCACSGRYIHTNKARHERSKKHQNYVNQE